MRRRLAVAYAVVAVLSTSLLGAYGLNTALRLAHENVEAMYFVEGSEAARLVEAGMAGMRSDVLFLAALPDILEVLRSGEAAGRAGGDGVVADAARTEHLEAIFEQLARAKGYRQVRLLDAIGQELVRVNYDGRAARRIHGAELQSKADRYYIGEALALGPGLVYVSPLDLNREQGEVEVPHQPIVRLATPVHEPGGGPRGLVVLNGPGDALLGMTRRADDPAGIVRFLVDADGYYLRHSADPSREFGGPTDLGTGAGLRRDFPALADRVLSDQRGETYTDDDRVIFHTPIRPLAGRAALDEGRLWVYGVLVPVATAHAGLTRFWWAFGGALAVALLLAGVASGLVTPWATRPVEDLRRAVRRVAAGDLEQPVAVRGGGGEMAELAADLSLMSAALRQREQEQAALLRLSQTLVGALEQHQVANAVASAAARALRTENAVALCHDAGRAALVVEGEVGWGEEKVGQPFADDPLEGESYMCYRALRERRPVVVEGFGDEVSPELPPLAVERCLRSGIAVPMLVGEEAIGVLAVHSWQPRRYAPEEVRLLGLIGNQAAVAVRAAAAHEQLRALAGDLERQVRERTRQVRLAGAALEAAANAIVVADRTGTIVWANPAFERLTGYSREEVIGRSPSLLKSGLHPPEFYRELWRTILSGQVWRGEIRNRRKDGSLYLEAQTITPVSTSVGRTTVANGDGGEPGEITHFVAIKEDVTEQRRAQEALAWEARVNALLAEIAGALLSPTSLDEVSFLVLEKAKLLTDSPSGFVGYVEPGTGQFVSPTLTRGTGEDCGTPDRSAAHRMAAGLWGWALVRHEAVLANSPADDPRWQGLLPGHLPIRRFLSAPALAEESLVGQIVLANAERDYGERDLVVARHLASLYALAVRREQVLGDLAAAREAAEAANRAKSEFLANMSHELRTPLNAIIGFSEVLAEQAFGPLNARQAGFVGNVLSAGRHLLALINDILDLARIEAGRTTLELAELDVATTLTEVQPVVAGLAARKRLALTIDVEPGIPRVRADSGKLRQIMLNLLSNAVKFTPEGGSIRVTARRAEQLVEVAVADSGIGIRPENQERIFHAFEQVDSSYARRQQGTGLGLALTHQLVELHGGRIWVTSEGEGKGSTFVFTIPVWPGELAAPPPSEGAAAGAGDAC